MCYRVTDNSERMRMEQLKKVAHVCGFIEKVR